MVLHGKFLQVATSLLGIDSCCAIIELKQGHPKKMGKKGIFFLL